MALISTTSGPTPNPAPSPTNVAEDHIDTLWIESDDAVLAPKESIIRFVTSISDILEDIPFEGFIKISEICEQRAYRFRERPLPFSLANAINEMISDQNSLRESHPKVYYFYQVMVFKFLQKCIRQVDPENGSRNADNLILKMSEAHTQFMNA